MARATGEASKSAGRSLSAMAEAAKASTAQFRELVSSVSAVVGAVTRMVSVAGLAVGSLVAIGRGIRLPTGVVGTRAVVGESRLQRH